MFWEIIYFYCESCVKHINTLYGNVHSLSVTNAYHWALKWKTFTVDTHTFTDKSN